MTSPVCPFPGLGLKLVEYTTPKLTSGAPTATVAGAAPAPEMQKVQAWILPRGYFGQTADRNDLVNKQKAATLVVFAVIAAAAATFTILAMTGVFQGPLFGRLAQFAQANGSAAIIGTYAATGVVAALAITAFYFGVRHLSYARNVDAPAAHRSNHGTGKQLEIDLNNDSNNVVSATEAYYTHLSKGGKGKVLSGAENYNMTQYLAQMQEIEAEQGCLAKIKEKLCCSGDKAAKPVQA